MITSEELVVAIDIGNHYLKILVSNFSQENTQTILAYTKRPLKTKQTILTSIQIQIKQVLADLEKELNCSLESSFYIFAIPNNLIKWKIATININIDDNSVKNFHMVKAKKDFLENDSELNLVNVYKNCIVDNNRCVPNPIGVSTNTLKLESFVASWLDRKTQLDYSHFTKLIGRKRVFAYPSILTLPYSYLDDNDNGTLFIDLGANEINYLFFRFKLIGALGSYNLGINCLIKDLTIGLKLSTAICRNIVEKDLEKIYKDDSFYSIQSKTNQKRYIPHTSIRQIIDVRLEEISHSIKVQIQKSDNNFDYEKIVLIGGGANIQLIHKIIQKNLKKPTIEINSKNNALEDIASYSVTLGLLQYYKHYLREKPISDNSNKILNKIRRFFTED